MDKTKDQFRNYDDINPKVIETYKSNHKYQTFDYMTKMKQNYYKRDKAYIGLWDAISLCNDIIDESDPDLNLPQIYHSIQTAENLRMHYPNRKDLHLIGLIHDLGKIMLLPEFGNLPQWSVVGDIYPLGCAFNDKIVYSEFFSKNPDSKNDRFNTKYGIYEPNCGFDNVQFSWSHDEYLYSVLKNNHKCTLPDGSLKIIRYHSFYPFHKENEYLYLANENDMKLQPLLHLFSKCDLYSKDDDNKINIDDYKTYYSELIDEYCPGKFNW